MSPRGILTALVALGLVAAPALAPAAGPRDVAPAGLDVTPPRLGAVWGHVSFWRPGDESWSPAAVNTPLAPGDELATGADGTLEVEIARRAFLRVRPDSRLVLDDQRPGALVFRLEAGEASLDLRDPPPDQALALHAPGAALVSPASGLYRVRAGSSTVLTARRGGRALVTVGGVSASASPVPLHDGEEIIVGGGSPVSMRRRDAPAEDAWDRWNDARTASLGDELSAPRMSPGVAGAHDLDRHGRWTSTGEYGPVWVPDSVPADWTPYSTGRWIRDSRFDWTWVDEAPWGWLPYHYGRWVFVDGAWGWAPGPRAVHAAYNPALVAFFGGAAAGHPIGWVALGWGEPVVPWWGPPSFGSRPWWGGWAGPRVVNRVVVHRTAVVPLAHVTGYRNARVRNALVVVPPDRFGRGQVRAHRIAHAGPDIARSPIRGRLPVTPARLERDPRRDHARDVRHRFEGRRDGASPRQDGPERRRASRGAWKRRHAGPGPTPAGRRLEPADTHPARRPQGQAYAPRGRREVPVVSPPRSGRGGPRSRDGKAWNRARKPHARPPATGPSMTVPGAGERPAAHGDPRLRPGGGKAARGAVGGRGPTRAEGRKRGRAPGRSIR